MKDFRELLRSKRGIQSVDLSIDSTTGERLVFSSRNFEAIKVRDYMLSVQASENHYCTPRRTLSDVYEYSEMEVALLKDNEFVDVAEDQFFNSWERREEFLERFDGQVAPYVSIEVIQSLFEFIMSPIASPVEEYLNSLFFEGDDL